MTSINDTNQTSRRWRLPARGLAVLAAVLVASSAPGASAATSGGAPADTKPTPNPASNISLDVRAKMDAQQPVKAAASLIQWSVARGDTGYAGIGLGTNEVVVWWKGALSRPVEETIATARKTTPVRVVAAAHSRAELRAAAQGIRNYLRTNPGSPYHGVDIAYDGSGLVVNTEPALARPAVLPAAMKVPAGIRVTVAPRERAHLGGRLDDYAPYWGGGRIQNNDNGGFCTAGFPVTAGGANYMLTAGHCGRPGGSWNNGNDTLFFGTGAYEHVAHDLLLISASVAGRIWDGGVGWGEFTKGVAGWDWVSSGEWLCTSGSVTGALCNHIVGTTFSYTLCDYDAYGNWECYDDLVLATQADGLTAVRKGDSGGPVFGLWGADRVIAKGTITGYFGSNGMIFQDFATAWWDFGVTPVIG